MIEEAKENIVTRAASTHAVRGRCVLTGTSNVKLIMMISLSFALTEQRKLKAPRSLSVDEIFTTPLTSC
jgi:hypothetical protein